MFFQTAETIPEGLGFTAFGATHILWLLGGLLLWVGACILHKRLSEKKRKIMRAVLGGYILLQDIAFDVVRPTRVVRSFLYYFAIPGAALALLFPNWTAVPFLNFFHMHSFTIHILLVLYPLLLVTTGQVDAKFRSAGKGVLLLIGMAIPIYFLNLLWDTNFMFLMDPDSGNPLELFEQILGSHLWGFPILLPVVVLLMYLPLRLAKKRSLQPV